MLDKAAHSVVEEMEDFPEYGIDFERAKKVLRMALREARRFKRVPHDVPPEPRERPVVVVSSRYLREIAADSWNLLAAVESDQPAFFRVGDGIARLEHDHGRIYARLLRRETLIGHWDRLTDHIICRALDQSPHPFVGPEIWLCS